MVILEGNGGQSISANVTTRMTATRFNQTGSYVMQGGMTFTDGQFIIPVSGKYYNVHYGDLFYDDSNSIWSCVLVLMDGGMDWYTLQRYNFC
jgi:hypothetical protein